MHFGFIASGINLSPGLLHFCKIGRYYFSAVTLDAPCPFPNRE